MSVYRIDINVNGVSDNETESRGNGGVVQDPEVLGGYLLGSGLSRAGEIASKYGFSKTVSQWETEETMKTKHGKPFATLQWREKAILNPKHKGLIFRTESVDIFQQIRTRGSRKEDWVTTDWELSESTPNEPGINKPGAFYAAGLATKVATNSVNNIMRWNTATAQTTAEKQAINSINNGMSMLGGAARIGAYAYAGGRVGGIYGAVAGAAIGIGTSINDMFTADAIRRFEYSLNRINSESQLAVLGDATYGRSRGDK